MRDALAERARIGLLVPSTNTIVQPECEALRPRGVTNHIARITIQERPLNSEQAFLEHVQAMRDGIGAAADQMMTARPDALIMGVALEAFWGGIAQAEKLRSDLAARAGVPVFMGSTATVAALHAFGARRIAVLTPHQPRGDAMVQAYLEEAGFTVTKLLGLKCASPTAIGQVSQQQIRNALRELDSPDTDAILQVGTNLAGITPAAEAERWLGKPVLAINATTYWHTLRGLDIPDRIHSHGRILEEF